MDESNINNVCFEDFCAEVHDRIIIECEHDGCERTQVFENMSFRDAVAAVRKFGFIEKYCKDEQYFFCERHKNDIPPPWQPEDDDDDSDFEEIDGAQ